MGAGRWCVSGAAAGAVALAVVSGPGPASARRAEAGIAGVIGGAVWHDANHDGLRSADEPGIAGVGVRLYEGTGMTEVAVGPDGRLGTTDAR